MDLAHVVTAVYFLAEVTVQQPVDAAVLTGAEIIADLVEDGSTSEAIERRASDR